MDIFSVGCVIAELFTEGTPPFDLSKLLAYRSGDYSPWKLLSKIEDVHTRELIQHMLQKDPKLRLSAEEYLATQRGKAFPEHFYTFLKLYIEKFSINPNIPADEPITRIHRDMESIVSSLGLSEMTCENNTSLVILLSVVTSNLRNVQYCSSKLLALEVLLTFSCYVTADIILDRIIPYTLCLLDDKFPRVRAEAIHTITHCLKSVKSLPVSDTHIFPEYILPHMHHLSEDSAVMVRVAYAENIASLAETAHGFLEMVQLDIVGKHGGDKSQEVSQYQALYDEELQALHEMIQQKVVTLLSDPENIVKRTLLENGITRLCVFFGRQKANDVLLSHMITFLNDKFDWQLRADFFESLVGLATYIGWESSSILKPLLLQGLSDTEEFVIHKTLSALTSLMELGLLQKQFFHELLIDTVPFFCHPNIWIREGAVGFVSATARTLNIADVHCNVLPLLQPFLRHSITLLHTEVNVLNVLKKPLPRVIYDYVLKSSLVEKLFDSLQDRQLIRNICRAGHKPNYPEVEYGLAQLFRKLASQGMTVNEEDLLLAMKDFMLKLHRARSASTEQANSQSMSSKDEQMTRPGVTNLKHVRKLVIRRHADLVRWGDPRLEGEMSAIKKLPAKKPGEGDSPSTLMNEDWKQMFGSMSTGAATTGEKAHRSLVDSTIKPKQPSAPQVIKSSDEQSTHEKSRSRSNTPQRIVCEMTSAGEPSNEAGTEKKIHEKVRCASCKVDLQQLVHKKRVQFANNQLTKDLLSTTVWETKSPSPSNWRPKGQLVSHLHEHRGAVNRIRVSEDSSYFVTCSNDGSVKVWDCSRMEGRSVTNRSRLTYNKQGGQMKTISCCESSQSIASASDRGTIHVFRTEAHGHGLSVLHSRSLNLEQDGQVVDMTYYDTGSQNVLVYATVHGTIIGWDLRTPRDIWTLHDDPKHGLITSFDVHPQLSWLVLGTSSGTHVCWDMRFQLPVTTVVHPTGEKFTSHHCSSSPQVRASPVTTVVHPTGARVKRVLTHGSEQSCVVSAVQGNNEVSVWDIETGARCKTLWASSTPPLSLNKASHHSVNGQFMGPPDNPFLLTAGSDMRIRYWDLNCPSKSHLLVPAAGDPTNQTVISYRSQLIEGTEVLQETYSPARSVGNEDIPRRVPDMPPVGHHDIITDLNVCQRSQCFFITSSRNGVVKVWK
ncbi:Phosphoinositide 3-kinase regulatory subunit 4 [Lamellibrachia satsuma]|nr:Phosphoinositide 3-kinase regulatory subunit 4 [Lamellibrachia satsuma]